MQGRLAVVSLFALTVGCSSHELAAVAPSTTFHVRAEAAPPLAPDASAASSDAPRASSAATAPTSEWSDAVPQTQPVEAPVTPVASPDEPAAPWQQHISFFIGRRNYSDGSLDQNFSGGGQLDMKDSGFKGLETDGCDPRTGHGYEFGIIYAYQTDGEGGGGFGDYELVTDEIYGGYRHTFRTAEPDACWHPYVGVGLEVIRAHFDSPGFEPYNDDASALAGYARIGMTWDVGHRFRLGLDARELVGTNDFTMGTPDGTSQADVDNQQVAFTIGYLL